MNCGRTHQIQVRSIFGLIWYRICDLVSALIISTWLYYKTIGCGSRQIVFSNLPLRPFCKTNNMHQVKKLKYISFSSSRVQVDLQIQCIQFAILNKP